MNTATAGFNGERISLFLNAVFDWGKSKTVFAVWPGRFKLRSCDSAKYSL